MRRTPVTSIGAAIAAGLFLTACSESTTEPDVAGAGQVTVNAEATWAYLGFQGDGLVPVNVVDPALSQVWDIALYGTSVMLNGGAAGPGGLEGHCLCQNRGATNAQVMAFTAANQRAAFEAIGAAHVPQADTAWKSDALAPAIAGWYRYDLATHTVAAVPEKAFYIRTSEGGAYAKFRVTLIDGATRTSAGRVTFEYALQSAAGAALGAVQTRTVEVAASGRVSFDFESGTATTNGWDIALEGFVIRVNGGVSGTGSAGAVAATEPFEAIDDPSGAPASVYKGDAFGGVFDSHRWYRYNLTGTDHQVWPTFDVYLVRKGNSVYKLQLTNYYGAAGEARHITLRYGQVVP